MRYGSPVGDRKPNYPDDCIQSIVQDWWLQDEKPTLCRGRLLWAFLPHVDQEPRTLTPIGRTSPTDHHHAQFRVEPLRIDETRKAPKLPIAGLPGVEGEVHTVHRSKVRPAVVVGGIDTPDVDAKLRQGMAKYQTSPTLLVAPYYGVEGGAKRGGFNPEFVARVRRSEYPQYIWDLLPIGDEASGSLLRLDHIQPIGKHYNAYRLSPFRLSNEALDVFDEWLAWLLTGELDPDGVITLIREELARILP